MLNFFFWKNLTSVCLCPQLVEKEEFEQQLKDLEEVCMAIVTKLYQGASGTGSLPGGIPGGFPGAGGDGGDKEGNGSIIEEVD